MLESVQDRHPEFRDQVEMCDAQIFLSIPALVILHKLHSITQRFNPGFVEPLFSVNDQASLEKDILELGCSNLIEARKIKAAGVQLSRSQPEEWNQFVNVCIN